VCPCSVRAERMTGRRPSRARRRRIRLLRLVLVAVVVVAVALAATWIATARAVVPGLSGKNYPVHYLEGIARVAEEYELDPYLVAAVVQTESGYDARAVSRAGAVGLMQLMPDTAEWIVGLDSWRGTADPELTHPEDNLQLGACYLAYLLASFGRDTRIALAAYNAGQGSVAGWMKEAGIERLELSDIRYPETREFVERVEHYREVYQRVHPDAFGRTIRAA